MLLKRISWLLRLLMLLSADDSVPVRMQYPLDEQKLNNENWTTATNGGADNLLTTKM